MRSASKKTISKSRETVSMRSENLEEDKKLVQIWDVEIRSQREFMTMPFETTYALYAAKRYERAVLLKLISKSSWAQASRAQLSSLEEHKFRCKERVWWESPSCLGPMMPSRGGEPLQLRSTGKREPSSKQRDNNSPSTGQSLQARRSTKSCYICACT